MRLILERSAELEREHDDEETYCRVYCSRRMPSVELQVVATLRDLFLLLLPERNLRAPSESERQQRHRADTERQWSAERQLLATYTRFVEQLELRARRHATAPRVSPRLLYPYDWEHPYESPPVLIRLLACSACSSARSTRCVRCSPVDLQAAWSSDSSCSSCVAPTTQATKRCAARDFARRATDCVDSNDTRNVARCAHCRWRTRTALSLQVSRLVCDSLARVLQADSSRGSWSSRRECASLHILHAIASESRRRRSPLQLAPRVRLARSLARCQCPPLETRNDAPLEQ